MKSKHISRRVLIALSTASVAAIALSACAGGEVSTPDDTSDALRIVMISNEQIDPFTHTVYAGAKAKAEELGVELDWQAPATPGLAEQTQTLQSVAASQPDAIFMGAADADGMIEPIRAVVDSGIPVYMYDTPVNDPDAYLGLVSSDNFAGGELAAAMMSELSEGGPVAYEGYGPGIASIDARFEGWSSALADLPQFEDLGALYSNADIAEITANVDALLRRAPDLAGIFACCTIDATGVTSQIESLGLQDQVTVIAFDAAPEQIEALKRGAVDALIVQNAWGMGETSVQALVDYLRDGIEPEKTTHLEYVVITPENVDDPDLQKYFYQTVDF